MARRKNFKSLLVTKEAEEALEQATGEIGLLLEEMESWRDNMDGLDGLEYTPKYEEVSEAADQLEDIANSLEKVTLLSLCAPGEILPPPVAVEVWEMAPYGNRAAPRWMRAANAAKWLRIVGDLPGLDAEIAEDLDDRATVLEEIAFPSMY